MEPQYAKVLVAGGQHAYVPIGVGEKPPVPPEMVEKWNEVLNLMAKILHVPAGLITRVHHDVLEVFQSNTTDVHPFSPGATEKLGFGLYCETVVARRETLNVTDASQELEYWNQNPDIALGFTAYLGMPLVWPDGEIFGTICALDTAENFQDSLHTELLQHFRHVVQQDLQTIVEKQELQRMHVMHELSMKEAFHRMKNHLSTIHAAIQLRQFESPPQSDEEQFFLETVQRKIQSIISLHDVLTVSQGNEVFLLESIQNAGRKIVHEIYGKELPLHITGDKFTVPSNIALTTLIIVSELITNSLKHAFANVASPQITISLRENNGEFQLDYADNGRGMTPKESGSVTASLGLALLTSYPATIGGAYTMGAEGVNSGFQYRLTAPLRLQADSSG